MSTTFINMRMICMLAVFILFAIVITFILDLPKNIKEQSLPSKFNNLWIKLNIKTDKYLFKQIDSLLSNHQLFQTYSLLLQTNENLETSYECIGPSNNRSCLYKNLYYTDKTFWMFTSKKVALPFPDVRIGAFIMSEFNPEWRPFYSYEYLDTFVRHKINPVVIPNLTVYFQLPWLSNIGHVLFDGLYPGYVALIRFSPKHLQPFRILLSTDKDYADFPFSKDVYNDFAGLGTLNMSVLEEISVGRWFAFQEIVMGSGNLCQRCLQPNFQLPGGIELNGSRLFRDRMYQQHGFALPITRQNYSAESPNAQKTLKAYVIDNKRFTNKDKIEINAAIDEINMYTNTHQDQTKLQWPLINISYISYSHINISNNNVHQLNDHQTRSKIPMKYSRMAEHLRLLQNMDIYVTGPGTGQMYQTFLADGSVLVNLGGLGYIKQNNTVKKYASFLEQYMTAGTPYIKGLYYPINERSNDIKRDILISLIRKAGQLIVDGFSIPVNARDNLAPDGQLFIEMCELDKEFCTTVTERSEQNNFLCIDTWPEEIIHENGPWSSEYVLDNNKTFTCSHNRTLLFQLKKKYNINS